MPNHTHTVEVLDNMLLLFDADGYGLECYILENLPAAIGQIKLWQIQYDFSSREAVELVGQYFDSRSE